MTSDIQLEANRINSQKSTGPTSEAGKSAIRLNAMRHGLTSHVACMTWEDRDAFNAFCAAIVADLKPDGALETQLAQVIAEDHWRINRAHAIEENLFALGTQNSTLDADGFDTGAAQVAAALSQAETFRNDHKTFNLITLYASRINRDLHRNMDRLAHIQENRRVARVAAFAELRALNALNRARSEAIRSHNGFVFSDAEIALAEATVVTAGPPKTPKPIRTIAFRDAA